jgi:hypothetical protein
MALEIMKVRPPAVFKGIIMEFTITLLMKIARKITEGPTRVGLKNASLKII